MQLILFTFDSNTEVLKKQAQNRHELSLFTDRHPALLLNTEQCTHSQVKEQSILQEMTNCMIHLINELGSIHHNRTLLT